MKKNTLLTFVSLLFFITTVFTSCDQKDDLVVITYQHIADFQQWNFPGASSINFPKGDANHVWHVYMLKGINNTGKEAQPFTFYVDSMQTNEGERAGTNSWEMEKADEVYQLKDQGQTVTLYSDFKTATVPPHTTRTRSLGKGELFFIKDTYYPGDRDKQTKLTYKRSKDTERVLLQQLDGTANIAFIPLLNEQTLDQLVEIQKGFDKSYDVAGNKKN